MNRKWLKVTLDTDVVVTAEGGNGAGHSTLQHLPGSLFFGFAASHLAQYGGFDPEFLYSGRLRFSNALPLAYQGESDSFALAVPVPKSLHYLKNNIEGMMPNGLTWTEEDLRQFARDGEQVVAARGEFLSLGDYGHLISLPTKRTGRTAIDPKGFDRAKDEQYFEYEAIERGAEFALLVEHESDDCALTQSILDRLTSAPIAVGRSRSAEFGRVSLEALASEPELAGSQENPQHASLLSIYLLSDLALPAPNSISIKAMGLPEEVCAGATFVPQHTFFQTRSYSPWNSFYGRADWERQLVAAGSVISFRLKNAVTQELLNKLNAESTLHSSGSFQMEGFGRFLINPSFLYDDDRSGAKVAEVRVWSSHEEEPEHDPVPESPLSLFMSDARDAEAEEVEAIGIAANRADEVYCHLHGDKAPKRSQWSSIRTLAQQFPDESLAGRVAKYCGLPDEETGEEGARTRHRRWSAAVDEHSVGETLVTEIREWAEDYNPRMAARVTYHLASTLRQRTEAKGGSND